MVSKVTMQKKVGDQRVTLYPSTSADNVMYDSNSTVKDVVDALILEIRNLERVLSIDSLYIRDSDGETLLNDGKGNNLVAVASLVADIDENASN